MDTADVTVTPYTRKHRQSVSDLFFRSQHIHSHLDWYDMNSWLDMRGEMTRLVWRGDDLTALMALSPPLNNTAWVRLMALHDREADASALRYAWNDLCIELQMRGVNQIAILQVRDWVVQQLPTLGFHYQEHIVTMRRLGQFRPPAAPPAAWARLRAAEVEDVEVMAQVDQTAFSPPWQMAFEDVREARRGAALSMIAEDPDGAVVGYCICTQSRDSAHLARLAVLPRVQGQGVGLLLVMDAITRFARRNIHVMTVNTQESNVRSQRLYKRCGFQHTRFDLPVWFADI
jgi:[ribosomal protein S18]-alanine N-acetyltransferase